HVFPHLRSQLAGNRLVAHANKCVDMWNGQAKIEEDALPVFISQRLSIGPELGKCCAPVHDGRRLRKAKGEILVPAQTGGGLERGWPQARTWHDADAPASCN